MATTVAHGLIGISTYCVMVSALPAARRLPIGPRALLLAALAANIPDLDMLISLLLLSDHKLLHGGITHSFAFAGMVAILVWMVGRWRGLSTTVAIISFFLVASHVVVDWFTGPQWGLHPSHGLALFWPVSDTPIRMPLTLFKGVIHGDLFPGALYTALWELMLLGPVTGMLFFKMKKTISNRQLLTEEI
jgi:membrane-bound metal-dependent hydrolase YbcI (DUF457 family)